MSTVNGIISQMQGLIDEALKADTTRRKNELLQELKKITTMDVILGRLRAIEEEPFYHVPIPVGADIRLTPP